MPELKSLARNSFTNCNELSEISLPELQKMNGNNFKDLPKLSKIDMPSLESMSDGCFTHCGNLLEAKFDKFKVLPATALSDNPKLQKLSILSLGKVDDRKFEGLKFLESVTFGDSIRFIGFRSFANTPIRSVRLPKRVLAIYEEHRRHEEHDRILLRVQAVEAYRVLLITLSVQGSFGELRVSSQNSIVL
jgi:hypothetical protein